MEFKDEVIVNWELGLHIRPATHIVKLLQKYQSEITFDKDSTSCNAKSVMQLITLGAGKDDKIAVSAIGKDAKMAVEALKKFFDTYEDMQESGGPLW